MKSIQLNPDLRRDGDPILGSIAPIHTTFFARVIIGESSLGKKVGRGVFAEEKILKGRIICIGGGQVFSDLARLPHDKDYAGVFDEKHYIAPIDYHDPSENWLINHSCQPNVKLIGRLVIMAARDMAIGEELLIDYGTVAAGAPLFKMSCCCGSPNCRGLVSGDDWKKQEYYVEHFEELPPFIQQLGVVS